MTATLKQSKIGRIIEELGIDRMSARERVALAHGILESVVEPMQGLSDAQKAELDRRIAYGDAHPEERIPWEVVKAEILPETV